MILRHVKEPYEYQTDASSAKFTAIYRQVSPASLPNVFASYCQRALVDESGMIGTQARMHNRSAMVAVHGTPCAIPPRNSYINSCADKVL
jgi:hypothetical protein